MVQPLTAYTLTAKLWCCNRKVTSSPKVVVATAMFDRGGEPQLTIDRTVFESILEL